MEEVYLAVEGGGSKSRAVLEHHGCLFARTEWRGLNPNDIGPDEFDRRLRSLLAPLLGRLATRAVSISACFAMAGVGKPALRRQCRAIASRVVRPYGTCRHLALTTDAEALARTCLQARNGVVLIAGTGSVALGVRRRDGRGGDGRQIVVKVGGLGGLADTGSGFSIGMALIEHCLRAVGGSELQSASSRLLCKRYRVNLEGVPKCFFGAERSRVSSLAPSVLECYRQGDPAARSIVYRAVGDLVLMVVKAKQRAGLPGRFPVYVSGGLFRNDAFRRLFLGRLRSVLPRVTTHNVTEPLLGVLQLARRVAPV